jgi:hypothetical protein
MSRERLTFFIAGVQKAGTTALARMLVEHPQLELPPRKELHYFDNDELNWEHPDYELLHARFPSRNEQGGIRGDATPSYTYWPECLARIRTYNPDAKLIVLLRHPAFRAFSGWRMARVRGNEPLAFANAIRAMGRERVRQAPRGFSRRYSYVERSFYAPQVGALLTTFDQRRVRFVRTDRLFLSPNLVLHELHDFLGVARRDAGFVGYVTPTERLPPEPLPAADRVYLDELFRSDIEQTAKLTRLDLQDWLSPDYADPMHESLLGGCEVTQLEPRRLELGCGDQKGAPAPRLRRRRERIVPA